MRLSSLVLLGASAAMLVTTASASVFYSSQSATPNSTATLYAGYSPSLPSSPPDGDTTRTYNIGTGNVWANPVGPSSWVSYDPNTEPGGSVVASNGYYDYKIDLFGFTNQTISLTVLADDTTNVYRNFFQILPEGDGPYPECAVGQPNCINAYTFTFTAGASDVLDFEVHQAAGYSTGLDFYGQTVTPEPGSLMLLGSGLLTGAGTLLRRLRRA